MNDQQALTLTFHGRAAWSKWLGKNHAKSPGVWLRMAKKDSGLPSLTHDEALCVALCYGWIAEIERAKQDGRWDAAYDSPSRIEVPADLRTALLANARAKAFFETLDSRNRYAVLFRIHQAKKAETRARRIRTFVAMLARRKTLYP